MSLSSSGSVIMPGWCIFPLATWRERGMAASMKSCVRTTLRAGLADFDAEQEWRSLHELVKKAEEAGRRAGSHR